MVPGPVVYPRYLDLSKDDCCRFLRQLELEAYASIISALRSQGDLTKEKKELLVDICATLGISQERHRAEIRRAVNDEKLATIALHVSDSELDFGWVKEGRRIAPILPRPLPITACMEKADRVAEMVARENALLPPPSITGDPTAFTLAATRFKPPEIPPEVNSKGNAGLYSSLYCIKCQKRQEELVDEYTSTDDLQLVTAQEKNSQDMNMAPSASDSYVFLPGGTTVRVELGSAQKEEPLDAYSLKASSSGGNIDFENAPDISLSGPRSAKRKRKKSISISGPGKEVALTIKQVIKPPKMEEIKLPEIRDEIICEEIVAPEPDRTPKEKPAAFRGNKSSSGKRKSNPDSQAKHPSQSSSLAKSKRKSKTIPHVAIQHTPVPPEHLYAVGSSHRARQRQNLMSQPSDDSNTITASQKLGLSKHQSPSKHVISHQSTGIGPMSPPSHQHQTFSSWVAEGSLSSSISNNFSISSAMAYSQSARFSSSKPSYLPPNIIQNSYGRAQRFRANFPVIERQAVELDQRRTNKFSVKKETKRPGLPSDFEDPSPPKKVFRSSAQSPASHLKELRNQSTKDSPNPDEISIMRQRMFANTSGLDELASVSLMDSASISSTIVETGLAPVSAIVSRVTSPAPRPLSSIPSATKNMQGDDREEGNSVKIINANEGIQFFAKQAHGMTGLDSSVLGSAGSHVAISNQDLPTLSSSSSFSRPVVIVDSKQQSYQREFSDSIVAMSGSSSSKSQVRVTLTESLTHVGPSASLSSSIYPISLPQASRTISSVAGKSHTVLKSSTGNVITVTAKPLTGMKSVPNTIQVSGGNIMKPPLGQKTSIIVVHKAAGAKAGKSVPTNFTTIGGDGQPKVITVSTKNITTPTVNLPRPMEEASDNTPTSFSALGSIQGLVSGLTTSTTAMKPGMIPGSKPKFVAMPLHKKTMICKPGELQRAKIIQKVIGPPGKVLVKTSTPPQIRNFSTSRMVKPIHLQSSGSVTTSPSNTQVIGSHDIVAAALSQSLGTVTQPREHGSPSASITGKSKPLEGPSPTGIIKLSTSTPAASTIKAFAANYQKKSSTSQQKQTLSLSTIHKPLPSTSVGQSSHTDKPKVFLTSSGHPKSQLFTPSQAQFHRPTKTGYLYDGRPPVLTGSAASYLATVGNLVKPLPKNTSQRMVYQQAPLHPSMQVKVLGQTSSVTRVPPRHTWQINSSPSSTAVQPQVGLKEFDETTAQTKILQDFLDSSTPVSQSKQPGNQTVSGSDRATFIYQYLPTASSSTTSVSNKPNPLGTISMSNMDSGDIITLHSVTSDTIIKEAGTDRDISSPGLKNTMSYNPDEGTKHTNFVKVNLPSVRAPSPVVCSTGNLNFLAEPASVDLHGFSIDESKKANSSSKLQQSVAAFPCTSKCSEDEPALQPL